MSEQKKVYKYISHNIWLPRLLAAFGLFSAITLTIGFLRHFNLNILYALIWGVPVFFVVVDKLIRYSVMLFSPKFDIKKHEAKITAFAKAKDKPQVDVFLPVAGEPSQLVEKTMKAISDLDYDNFQAYLLDDGQSQPELVEFSKRYGFKYLARENKGEFRKAGNLQYGYEHSTGKYVVVFDADFVPEKSFLANTIPYLESDAKIGILQTPQYFETTKEVHRRSPIEFGGGNVVEDFYRFDMAARDRFGAAMCVGTSAVYRREAIIKSGGVPMLSGTEDIRQGMSIHKSGFKVKYLPLILSSGISPDTIEAYFKQHKRWASGSVESFFGPYFWQSGLSNLKKLIYFSNFTFYVSNALSILLTFHIFTILFFHYENAYWLDFMWFIPQLLMSFVLPYFYRIAKPRFGVYIAAMTQVFAYIYTIPGILLRNIFGLEVEWVAANKKILTVKRDFLIFVNIAVFTFVAYILTFILVASVSPYNLMDMSKTGSVVIWFMVTVIISGGFVIAVSNEVLGKILHNHRQQRVSAGLAYRYLLGIPGLLVATFLVVAFAGTISIVQSNYRLIPRSEESDFLAFQSDLRQSYFGDEVMEAEVLAQDFDPEEGSVAGASTETGGFTEAELEDLIAKANKPAIESYNYEVEKGDNLSLIVRRAINEYSSDLDIQLSSGQKLYVEYNLLNEYNFSQLVVGQTVSVKVSTLQKYVSKASGVSESSLAHLDNYAKQINYT